MSGFTEDDFLGGRLRIRQPRTGYRAGIDPVFLAASVPARSGKSVLELGTGSGVALLCLMARVPGLVATGVERNAELAALATENVRANGQSARIVEADLSHLPADIRAQSFDHVIANPPFFDRAEGSSAAAGTREEGRGEDTPLTEWIDAAVRRLRPGGMLTMIQRAERMPDVFACLDSRMGDVTTLPLAARAGRPAKLFIFQAKKGAKGGFRLLSPFVLHLGDTHLADGDDYSPAASAILRDGAALELD